MLFHKSGFRGVKFQMKTKHVFTILIIVDFEFFSSFIKDGPVTNGLSRRERDETRARMLRAKANSGRNLTRWERNQLRRIEEDERLRRRNERRRQNAKNSICGKISLILAPCRALFGVLLLLLSLLIMTAIVITR